MIARKVFMRFPGGKKKALTFSYDDGKPEDIRLIGIMKENGLKGTFNLNTSCLPADLSVYEGMEIACHGYNHLFWSEKDAAQTLVDIVKDRENMEKVTGKIIRGMAYPYGRYDKWVVSALKDSGFVYSRTTVSTRNFGIAENWLELPATCHHNDPELLNLADKFLNDEVSLDSYLFYVWGHSYEFRINGNWNVIEEFAAKVANKEDVWYATNIEIYDYIEAYKSLIWGIDKNMVYNPTLYDIHFTVDTRTGIVNEYVVKSGETLVIE